MQEISKSAKSCQNCGKKYGLPEWAKFLIIIVIILICIIGCVNSCSNAVDVAVDSAYLGNKKYNDLSAAVGKG